MIRTLLLSIFLFCAITSFAQVGIGTTTPDPSAQLDVVSTNKGLLVPRVANTADVAGTPANGLIVYQTSAPEGFYVYTEENWQKLITSADSPGPTYAFLTSYTSRVLSPFEVYYSFSNFTSSGFSFPNNTTITPAIAGTYHISYKANCIVAGNFNLEFIVNGSSVFVLPETTERVNAEAIVYLPANANVRVKYSIQSGSSINVTFGSLAITLLK